MLKVENVDLFYGAAQALRDVSFEAEIGQVTCVLGRNGVGKTSLLRAIIGHLPIRSGRIVWDGQDISTLPVPDRAQRKIAYIPQGPGDLPAAHRQGEPGNGVRATAARAAFRGRRDLRSVSGAEGNARPGAEAISQAVSSSNLPSPGALVTRPRLLILDEPTEGIQPSIIKDIENVIRIVRERGEMAIVLVEQYFDFARGLADTFAVLDRGEVVLAGAMDKVPEKQIKRHLTV